MNVVGSWYSYRRAEASCKNSVKGNAEVANTTKGTEFYQMQFRIHVKRAVRYSLHGLCAFPNMVINVNIVRKSGKIRKNEETDVDHCQQCWCIVTWSVCIS